MEITTHKNRISLAKQFARKAHEHIILHGISGYERPQTEHLQDVADLVWAADGTEDEIIAAWLHDSVEDTPTTIADIEHAFGKNVAELVYGLTDLDEIKDLPTAERKYKQSLRVKTESESIRKIKLCDQISNIKTVVIDPPKEWLFEKNRAYVIGAKQIADECRGISTMLDGIFDREFKKAEDHFKIQ